MNENSKLIMIGNIHNFEISDKQRDRYCFWFMLYNIVLKSTLNQLHAKKYLL